MRCAADSMRYRISTGIIVKTENAAKPKKQRSQFLTRLILSLPPVSATFDYGCGKLRYKGAILKTTDTLALVDSEIQLSRKQRIAARKTSVRELLRTSNRIDVYNCSEFGNLATQFDR